MSLTTRIEILEKALFLSVIKRTSGPALTDDAKAVIRDGLCGEVLAAIEGHFFMDTQDGTVAQAIVKVLEENRGAELKEVT